MRALLFTTAVVGVVIGSGSMGASANPAYYGAERPTLRYSQPMHYRPLGGWAQSGRGSGMHRLPPISGVLHARADGTYGYPDDRGVRYAGRGPAIYDLRHREFHREGRGDYAGGGYGYRHGFRDGYQGAGYAGTGPAIYDVGHREFRREFRRDDANTGYGYGSGYAGYGEASQPAFPESSDDGVPAYGGQGFVSAASGGCGGCGPVAYQSGYGGYGYGQGGGLGVYSPGAYGPGPRIIAIPTHYNVSYEHHGCGCGSNSGLFGAIGGY